MSLFVHCGVGQYSNSKNDFEFNNLISKSLENGLRLLRNGESSLKVAALIVSELEKSPLTNAGKGSCLTRNGNVECDAIVATMTGDAEDIKFGAVAAAPGLDSPILVALTVCEEESSTCISGKEAWKWAVARDLSTVSDEHTLKSFHVTRRAIEDWNLAMEKNSYYQMIKQQKISEEDTVGCLCIDTNKLIAGACSSGGPIMRVDGRIGPAAIWGAGLYLNSQNACCATGRGETIMKRMLSFSGSVSVSLEKPLLDLKDVGLIRLKWVNNNEIEYEWAITAPAIAFGYASIIDGVHSLIIRKTTTESIKMGTFKCQI